MQDRPGFWPNLHIYSARGRLVYPRACGGTPMAASALRLSRGLSPRVRGNHGVAVLVQRYHGSIPARAGEPHGSPLAAYRHIYPLPAALGFDGAAEFVGVYAKRRGYPRPPDRLALAGGRGFGHDSHANTIRSAFSDRSFWAARWAVARTSYARVFMVNDLPDLAQMW